jgi:hypothetical protein
MKRTQLIYALAIFLLGGFLTATGFLGQMSVSADSPQLAGQVEMFTLSLIVGAAMIVVSVILFALAVSSN